MTGFPTFARHEKVYRGSFKVVDGDVFSDILSDPTSDAFLMKAQQYEMYIEDALSSGSLDTKQIHAEVVSFSRYVFQSVFDNLRSRCLDLQPL